MASIIVPFFLAATFCHLNSTVPLLDQNQIILKRNPSSDLFTSPILAAHDKMVSMGFNIITVDSTQSLNGNADTRLQLSDIDMFFDTNAAAALSQLSKTIGHIT
jgi:hypothetical protein